MCRGRKLKQNRGEVFTRQTGEDAGESPPYESETGGLYSLRYGGMQGEGIGTHKWGKGGR